MKRTGRSTIQSPDLRSRRMHALRERVMHLGLNVAAAGLSTSIRRTRPAGRTVTPITSANFAVWNLAVPLPFTFTVAADAAAGTASTSAAPDTMETQGRRFTLPVSAGAVRGR